MEVATTKITNHILPNQQWNFHKIHGLFGLSSAQMIKSMELPLNNTTWDFSYRLGIASGAYTTKSGYNFILNQQKKIYSMAYQNYMKVFRIIWSSNIMAKWKLFI